MQLRNHHDLWAGIMFAGFGLLFMALSQQYQLGSAAKMGPGYFPTMLGGLCTLLGLVIAAGAFSSKAKHARVAKVGWRELILVLVSVALFATLLPQLGIVVALVVLVGGTECAVVSRNDTAITCSTPRGAGRVLVVVSTPLQSSAASPGLSVVYAAPEVDEVLTPLGRPIDGGFPMVVRGRVSVGSKRPNLAMWQLATATGSDSV